jgi:deferrochelatase/peroxidase EfeB
LSNKSCFNNTSHFSYTKQYIKYPLFFTFFSTSCHNQTVSTQFLYLLQVNYKKKDKKAQLLAFGADEEASMKSEQANTA